MLRGLDEKYKDLALIVKCISAHPTEAQIQMLGQGFRRDRSFGIAAGREYLVLGLIIDAAPQSDGRGAWVDVLMEPEIPTLISAPLCLFEIVDPRVSRHWEIRVSDNGNVRLWPSSFYREYYHDDLSNRDPETVKDFWHVHSLLETEANVQI
jgi:hypothetical protein